MNFPFPDVSQSPISNLISLDDQVALVTGAAQGLGHAVAAPIIRRLPRRVGLALSERLNRLGLELAAAHEVPDCAESTPTTTSVTEPPPLRRDEHC